MSRTYIVPATAARHLSVVVAGVVAENSLANMCASKLALAAVAVRQNLSKL
jgi:hypothetical protein